MKNSNSTLHQTSPALGVPLVTPVLGLVLATSNAIVVTWNPVPNAFDMFVEYSNEYSKSLDFAGYGQSTVSGSLNAATLESLQPGMTYYLRVKAGGPGRTATRSIPE